MSWKKYDMTVYQELEKVVYQMRMLGCYYNAVHILASLRWNVHYRRLLLGATIQEVHFTAHT